jgi:hypothetical protein
MMKDDMDIFILGDPYTYRMNPRAIQNKRELMGEVMIQDFNHI